MYNVAGVEVGEGGEDLHNVPNQGGLRVPRRFTQPYQQREPAYPEKEILNKEHIEQYSKQFNYNIKRKDPIEQH